MALSRPNLHDHVAAAAENVSGPAPRFLERAVHYDGLSPKLAKRLEARSRELAMEALKVANREANRALAKDKGGNSRWNFGVYVFHEDPDGTPDDDTRKAVRHDKATDHLASLAARGILACRDVRRCGRRSSAAPIKASAAPGFRAAMITASAAPASSASSSASAASSSTANASATAPDVPVRIDGEAASAKALRIGHVARVVAQRQANGMLTTNRIDAVSEVVGPIESVKGGEMTVLGQKVVVDRP